VNDSPAVAAERATTRADAFILTHARLTGALVGSLIALPLGTFMSGITPWHPGSVNIDHAVLLVAPPAAAISGAVIAPLSTRSAGAFLLMVFGTWIAGTLFWPLAAVVMPLWTQELSCFSVVGMCGPTSGMTAGEIIAKGMGDLGEWYGLAPASPIATWIYLPAIAIGAAAWVIVMGRIFGGAGGSQPERERGPERAPGSAP
jgi:hypothetical protein